VRKEKPTTETTEVHGGTPKSGGSLVAHIGLSR